MVHELKVLNNKLKMTVYLSRPIFEKGKESTPQVGEKIDN